VPGCAKGSADIIDERGETAAQRLAPGHQHVVVISLRLKGRRSAQGLFQPSADAIALDGAADAFRDCQSHARPRDGFLSRLLATAGLQRESLDRCAATARDTLVFGPSGQAANRFAGGARVAVLMQGVKAPFRGVFTDTRTVGQRPKPQRTNQAESFLRPRARRAASTLRPPTVAERERKPWRRLRTSLLG
jgi:hypothetical protein